MPAARRMSSITIGSDPDSPQRRLVATRRRIRGSSGFGPRDRERGLARTPCPLQISFGRVPRLAKASGSIFSFSELSQYSTWQQGNRRCASAANLCARTRKLAPQRPAVRTLGALRSFSPARLARLRDTKDDVVDSRPRIARAKLRKQILERIILNVREAEAAQSGG